MSVHVMALVYKARLLCPLRKAVALKLADCSDDEGRNIWPAVSTIAAQAEISERSVQNKLRDLLGAGLLVIVDAGGGRRQTTTYEFDMTALYDLVSGRRVAADGDGQFVLVEPPCDEPACDEAAALNPAPPAPFPADGKGAAPAPFPSRKGAPDDGKGAGGSKNPAPPAPYPSEPSEPSSLPPPPQGARESTPNLNGGDAIGWAKGWTPAAREALGEVRGSVTNGHVAAAYVDLVRATHNPPRDVDAAAYARQLGHRLGKFPAETLAALAEDTLATRSRDLEPALDLERKATAIAAKLAAKAAGVTAAPGANGLVSIRPTSPEWPAFLAHLEAKDPARAESERRRAPSSAISMPAAFLAACVARFGTPPATGATS